MVTKPVLKVKKTFVWVQEHKGIKLRKLHEKRCFSNFGLLSNFNKVRMRMNCSRALLSSVFCYLNCSKALSNSIFCYLNCSKALSSSIFCYLNCSKALSSSIFCYLNCSKALSSSIFFYLNSHVGVDTKSIHLYRARLISMADTLKSTS
jgi:hypothetical protein